MSVRVCVRVCVCVAAIVSAFGAPCTGVRCLQRGGFASRVSAWSEVSVWCRRVVLSGRV